MKSLFIVMLLVGVSAEAKVAAVAGNISTINNSGYVGSGLVATKTATAIGGPKAGSTGSPLARHIYSDGVYPDSVDSGCCYRC